MSPDYNIDEIKRKNYQKKIESYDKYNSEMRKSINEAVDRVNIITKGIESNSFFDYPEDNELESLRGSSKDIINTSRETKKFPNSHQKPRPLNNFSYKKSKNSKHQPSNSMS